MRRRLLAASCLVALAVSTPLCAAEENATPTDQAGVAVTIYNQDLAPVRDGP